MPHARLGLMRCLATCALLALLAAWPSAGRAAGRVECSAVRSKILGRPVRYCVLLPPSYDTDKTRRYPVLYYLHGLFDNEQSLVVTGGWNVVEKLREEGRIGEFLIVTPDGGHSFYINSRPSTSLRTRDGRERYEDFFLREFIPAIDHIYRTRAARASRGIMGVSMGGYGALRLAFRYPERFVSVSAHSAALLENLPEVATGPGWGAGGLNVLSEAFGSPPDRSYWAEQSPLRLARTSAGLVRLKIYFDCGSEDQYGFDAGARALAALLKSQRVPHEFHLYPGGHGWQYVAEHFSTSLEFHSRAFGLTPARQGTKKQ